MPMASDFKSLLCNFAETRLRILRLPFPKNVSVRWMCLVLPLIHQTSFLRKTNIMACGATPPLHATASTMLSRSLTKFPNSMQSSLTELSNFGWSGTVSRRWLFVVIASKWLVWATDVRGRVDSGLPCATKSNSMSSIDARIKPSTPFSHPFARPNRTGRS